VVLPSPFQQTQFNRALKNMLLSPQRSYWQRNGLAFAKQADIYSLPKRAADIICGSTKCQPDSGVFFCHTPLRSYFSAMMPLFDQFMALDGEVFRQQKGRLTQRVVLRGRHYFIKQHHGVGWREISKNIMQLRWPVLDAKNEWQALTILQALGLSVPTIFAYGACGINPAKRKSFILLEEIAPATNLEEWCKGWRACSPAIQLKHKLIKEVAHVVYLLHSSGINHRDLYLCHFLLDETTGFEHTHANNIKLSLIDLHRAQIRSRVPMRWAIKDLAGLYFSAKNVGLTNRDLYRFMQAYRKKLLRDILPIENSFWKKVYLRGEKLYRDHIK
jgi:tRNA A-37 threonylcarbamoyl transferase component Bud32